MSEQLLIILGFLSGIWFFVANAIEGDGIALKPPMGKITFPESTFAPRNLKAPVSYVVKSGGVG